MPATEQTWRDQRLLHVLFAVTGVLMLFATVWMFYADHSRQWKNAQRTYIDIETRQTAWRDQAIATETTEKHDVLMSRLLRERSKPIAEHFLTDFNRIAAANPEAAQESSPSGEQAEPSESTGQLGDLEDGKKELDELAADAKARGDFADQVAALHVRQQAAEQAQSTQTAAPAASGPATHAADEKAISDAAAALANSAEGDARSYLELAAKAAREAAEKTDPAEARSAIQTASRNLAEANRVATEAAIQAETAAAEARDDLLGEMRGVVTEARRLEDEKLRERKFKAADYDQARATRDIAIRDNRTQDEITAAQGKIDEIKLELDQLTLEYQAASKRRRDLQNIVQQITAEEDAMKKEVADNQAEIERLQKAIEDQSSSYFTSTDSFPYVWPGKRWLELPILDAFNSPRKINNLWTEGLTIQYGSFSKVRRFDRCTTCHQAIDKTAPGSAIEPAYEHAEEIRLVMLTPSPEERDALKKAVDESGQPLPLTTERVYGLDLAERGLVSRDEVAIAFVRNNSRAAGATLLSTLAAEKEPGGKILESMLHTQGWDDGQVEQPAQGLQMGDVITQINNTVVRDRDEAERMLLQTVKWGEPLTLTVRRGLPHPFASHPRLDLYVGSLSPHPMAGPKGFGCTICHEGQGSATAFEWSSHTPNDPREAGEWREKYGWFYNHHWIFPMYPQRFEESTCLKCHHNVAELEPSEKFPDPPAPKLMKGYNLIATYGCYGCHEINGFDGPDRRVGPDLRLEPNYYGAAQQLLSQIPQRTKTLSEQAQAAREKLEEATGEGGVLQDVDLENVVLLRQRRQELQSEVDKAKTQGEPADAAARTRLASVRALLPDLAILTDASQNLKALDEMATLAAELVDRPERDDARHKLYRLLTEDIAVAKRPAPAAEEESQPTVLTALGPESHKLESILKDVEVPGQMRKPGPALRYVASKNDESFMLDWISNPRHFRPNTRMPKFFGQTKHLEPSAHETATEEQAELEAVEGEEGKAAIDVANDFEPVEILAMSEYLLSRSQPFEYLQPPEGVTLPTAEEPASSQQVNRGKVLFETRGCLACHTHEEFPKALEYRHKGDLVQGPDLSGIGSKFDLSRNPDGARWLYSWIKEPTRYHPRTKMPDLFLDPYDDGAGNLIDPAADVAAFLLSHKQANWQPKFDNDFALDSSGNLAENPRAKTALRDLTLEYLKAAFFEKAAEEYYEKGVPEKLRGELKGAEVELISSSGLNDRQRLVYVGSKAIAKYGCYGCHDVPGFEDAKPIGTGLADWGRKDTSRLAFEHITHYLHGHAGDHGAAGEEHAEAEKTDPLPEFYKEAIEASHREGFIFQKLREPRSYDFEKADNKTYNEWLRMPQFPFDNEEREQVITFVLGLIADPPATKFVYEPSPRDRAIQEGEKVLAKYNCGGCHTLEMEKWEITYPPGEFRAPPPADTFSFLIPDYTPEQLAASKTTDRRGMLHATLSGQPFVDTNGIPSAYDLENDAPVEADEAYDPTALEYAFQLFKPQAIDGQTYMVGPAPFNVKGSRIAKKYPAHGGYLARYLVPRVVQIEREVNPAAKASEAWGWVPPPLFNEGEKAQPEWLYNFLLNPYPIRPAVFLRMPKFNLSATEAQALVNYFGAKSNANYPYDFLAPRQPGVLEVKDDEYAAQNQGESRLDDAMKIVTNNAGCVKCHLVSDFVPQGLPRAKAPNLADVYRRLRPDYLRPWIAKPDGILPYTGMPVNINPQTGFATQGLYHGTPTEQLDALVDLLTNFDNFTRRRTSISDLVQAANPMPAPGENQPPAAEGTPPTGSEGESGTAQGAQN